MQAVIDDLISRLSEFKSHIVALDDVKAEHSQLSAELETLQATLEATKEELTSAQTGLADAQVKNLKRYNEDIFNKNKELESLTQATANAKARFDTINVEIAGATKQHQEIEASLENLKKKHFG